MKAPSDYNVYLGHTNISGHTPLDYLLDLFSVEAIIIHPEYSFKGIKNDIALFRLKGTIDLDKLHRKVRCVCEPEPVDQLDTTKCRVMGWGSTGKSQSSILLEVPLPIQEDAVCTRYYKPYTERLVCAGNVTGQGSCSGDSGGPLVCPVKGLPDVHSLAGLVSFRISDCVKKMEIQSSSVDAPFSV